MICHFFASTCAKENEHCLACESPAAKRKEHCLFCEFHLHKRERTLSRLRIPPEQRDNVRSLNNTMVRLLLLNHRVPLLQGMDRAVVVVLHVMNSLGCGIGSCDGCQICDACLDG